MRATSFEQKAGIHHRKAHPKSILLAKIMFDFLPQDKSTVCELEDNVLDQHSDVYIDAAPLLA